MAIDLGLKKPLLVIGQLQTLPAKMWADKEYVEINLILGAMFAAYVPIEIREDVPSRAKKLDYLGVYDIDERSINIAVGLEEGRRIARDIAGSDPERMAAPRIADFIKDEFKNSVIKLDIENVDKTKYPLMAAVNRAASVVPRHDGRVVKLVYDSNDGVEDTVFLVGKGITYDTGGADVKAGGIMAGMHRDKSGAAAVTGLFKTLSLLKPKHLKVVGLCAYVRNSIGEESYVADEIITSRAKRRVRVGNTDAEGRMVMADLLCEAKEMALGAVNPALFTVATLTGHVIRAYGDRYTAVLGNGASREKDLPCALQKAGDLLGEPVEVSTIRREDLAFHKGFHEYDDILQSNNFPSSATARGHQTPAGFLILASGLDEHNLVSKTPLPYTHVDCAGSAGSIGSLPTAAPLLMFAAKYILPRLL